MKKLLFVFLILLLPSLLFAQETEYEICFSDKYEDNATLSLVTIDNTINALPRDIDDIENGVFRAALTEGRHHIVASIERYTMLDSIVFLSKEKPRLHFTIDTKNDYFLYEFREGFDKVYHGNISIGLKKDGTFLMKSFFHTSIVGCFQLERGKYMIEGNKLILNVNEYHAPCFHSDTKFEHQYIFTLKNDSIIDMNKYARFIERKYMHTK